MTLRTPIFSRVAYASRLPTYPMEHDKFLCSHVGDVEDKRKAADEVETQCTRLSLLNSIVHWDLTSLITALLHKATADIRRSIPQVPRYLPCYPPCLRSAFLLSFSLRSYSLLRSRSQLRRALLFGTPEVARSGKLAPLSGSDGKLYSPSGVGSSAF
jgi:hypothetical protein